MVRIVKSRNASSIEAFSVDRNCERQKIVREQDRFALQALTNFAFGHHAFENRNDLGAFTPIGVK